MNVHPSLVLAFLLASVYGLVFYLIFGHGWLRLIAYLVLGIVGFFLGQLLANFVGLALFNIGEMNLVEGTVTSWLALLAFGAWRRK
ncbi:MAG: hypothetical protein HZB51_18595 [Chloroflexi bacterium]|nr:hypothetical protein [Chloroflexota bacterium]